MRRFVTPHTDRHDFTMHIDPSSAADLLAAVRLRLHLWPRISAFLPRAVMRIHPLALDEVQFRAMNGMASDGTPHAADGAGDSLHDAPESRNSTRVVGYGSGSSASEPSFELPPAFAVPARHSRASPPSAAVLREENIRLQAARYAQGMALLQRCADPTTNLEVHTPVLVEM